MDRSSNDDNSSAASRANTFPWPPVLFLAALFGALLLGKFVPVPWPGLDDTPARLVGRGIGLLGIVLVFWAVVTLRRHATTLMPHGKSEALVTDGPYAFVRNPIYLGEAMALLGIAEISKDIWYAVAAILFVLAMQKLQVEAEERHLEARFGDAYRDYKSRVRRWL